MGLKFSQSEEPEAPRRGRIKEPPNYRLRGVQFRLMVLVGAVMLTLVLMYEAGKPSTWKWMFRGERDTAQPQREVDTRITPKVEKPAVPGAVAMTQPEDVEVELNAAGDPVVQTLKDGWAKQWGPLTDTQRDMLMQALMCARLKETFPKDRRSALVQVTELLDQKWQTYHINALEAVSSAGDDLSPQQQEGWANVLEKTQRHWADAREGLQQVAAGKAPDKPQQKALDTVQERLDELAFSLVEDNTLTRFDERHAWFRLVEKLQQTTAQQQSEMSTGGVSYLQLYDQPGFYRGKMVTVRGKARLAYRIPAARNFYGVEHYYVFWVKPVGANSPLIVYALDVPENFPPVEDRYDDPQDNSIGDLDVVFHAYLFKRRVYNAQIGTHLAPQLLAAAPVYTARPVFTTRHGDPPSFWMTVAGLAGIALLATGIAVAAYFGSQWRSRNPSLELADKPKEKPFKYLDHAELKPSVDEQLRQLAQRHSDAGGESHDK